MNQNLENNQLPKQWKMLFIAISFVYVFVNIFYFILGDFLIALPALIRTLIIACVFVPVFGKVIPLVQQKIYKWIIK